MAKLAFDSRWRPAVLQAGGVLLLALLARSVRFGSIAAEPEPRRRRQGEFADAAAQLLREGRAYGVVTEKLVRHYTERMAELTGLAPGAKPPELIDAVRTTAGSEAAQILENALARRPSAPREVARVAKQLDDLVKALRT